MGTTRPGPSRPASVRSVVDQGERGRDLLQRLALGVDAEHYLDQSADDHDAAAHHVADGQPRAAGASPAGSSHHATGYRASGQPLALPSHAVQVGVGPQRQGSLASVGWVTRRPRLTWGPTAYAQMA